MIRPVPRSTAATGHPRRSAARKPRPTCSRAQPGRRPAPRRPPVRECDALELPASYDIFMGPFFACRQDLSGRRKPRVPDLRRERLLRVLATETGQDKGSSKRQRGTTASTSAAGTSWCSIRTAPRSAVAAQDRRRSNGCAPISRPIRPVHDRCVAPPSIQWHERRHLKTNGAMQAALAGAVRSTVPTSS